MRGVPFTIDKVHNGFSQATGAVYVEGEDLVVEMQVKTLGFFHRAPRVYRFDLTDLEAVRHKRGLIKDELTLRTRPLELAARVPGAADGALCLRIARRDRAALDALLDRLELWRVEET